MTNALELRNASRRYGAGHTEVAALADVSLAVAPGEMLAVMGPSGSGKTTLLALAGGLDSPTSGSVHVAGHDLAGLAPAARARLRRHGVGYVFQQYNLMDGLTAAENTALPLELDGIDRRRARDLALGALERVEVAHLAHRFPDELSGGEQQRVAIARAFVGERRLLLADEPTGALDSLNGDAVLRMMRRHCDGGGAAVLVTHDARFAAWADRIVFLRDGRLIDGDAALPGPEVLLATTP